MQQQEKKREPIKVRVSEAFAGSVEGVERNTGVLPAYTGYENSVLLAKINPNHKFQKDHMATMSYAWVREITRKDGAPRRGLFIGGPKDAGKTTGLEQFHARLGVPLVAITCNRRQPLVEHLKKLVPDGEGGWRSVDGPLATAMKQGYPVVFNEISVMDPCDLVAMHDIIDRGYHQFDDGEVLQAARGFMVHATDNTMGYGDETGAYADTNSLNGATLRRFFKMEVDYPSADAELEILKGYYPDQHEEALKQYVKFANCMRSPYRQGKSPVTMGVGEVIQWVDSTKYFDAILGGTRSPAWYAFKLILGGLPAADMENAKKSFLSVFNIDVQGQ